VTTLSIAFCAAIAPGVLAAHAGVVFDNYQKRIVPMSTRIHSSGSTKIIGACGLGFAALFGLGCEANVDKIGPGTHHEGVDTSASALTVLNACTTISTPGTYVLGGSLTAPVGNENACIQIQSQGPVTLDCQNFEILTPTNGGIPISVANSAGFTIQNCFVGPTGATIVPDVQIVSSSNGTLRNNYFFRAPSISTTDQNSIAVASSSALTVTGNTFFVPYKQYQTSQSNISNNSFSCMSGDCTVVVESSQGTGNVLSNNTIDGKAGADAAVFSSGSDDGIIINDESSDTVTGNTISNVWDCGIEFTGNIIYGTFSGNTINNASLAGIGGWYWLSLYANTFRGNQVNGAANAFTFMRDRGLRKANWDGRGAAADSGVYFTGNVFDGNSLTNKYTTAYFTPAWGASIYIPFEESWNAYPLEYNGAASSAETVPTLSQFVLTGNRFSNNNFGTAYEAYFGQPEYPGAVIDQGGNTCAKTWRANYPLACGRQ
jgi:parallel beta-helix repeat protein